MSDFQEEPEFSCSVGQKTCKHDLDFPKGAEECVTLEGTLFDMSRVGQVSFRKSARVCAHDGESTSEVTSLTFLPGNLTSTVVSDLGVLRSNCSASPRVLDGHSARCPVLPEHICRADSTAQSQTLDPVSSPSI